MDQKDFLDWSDDSGGKESPGSKANALAPTEASAPQTTAAPASAPAGSPPPAKKKRAPKKAKKKGGITPMMEQFNRAKKDAPGALVFFRMGDFYEMFGEDAVTASREIGLTLTARDKGANAIPMAGIPVKAAEGYLIRLVRKGFKVAICEQLEDPRHVKGIVDRGVVRIVTPGTLTEENALEAKESNYLASVFISGGKGAPRAGLAWVDISTGSFSAAELSPQELDDELARIRPAELLWPQTLEDRWEAGIELRGRLGPRVTERDDWRFDRDGMRRALERHFKVKTLEGYGFSDDSPVVSAAGALIEYLEETQRASCDHVRHIQKVEPTDHLVLDHATRSCLELVVTQRGERREGTLLDSIDRSTTPMGARLMREWLLSPLTGVDAIQHRQAGVSEFVHTVFLREEIREVLRDVLDIERLVAKLTTGRASGRDLTALASSLSVVPPIKLQLATVGSPILRELEAELDALEDVTGLIRDTLVDSPPLAIKEGSLIRDGFSAELDELRQISGSGKQAMAQFQAREGELTGITGLRIGYNSVFGYFLEVPRGQVDRVPEHYIRKQTIKACERYITPELKEFETKVLKADEHSRDLEYDLFGKLRDTVAKEIGRILDTARGLATIDVLSGLGEIASEMRYCPPTIADDDAIRITEGRHPVIEQSAACEAFVPNDSTLDAAQESSRRIAILTGPNMAGKSTFIRQTALIVLLAQVGSWVPAQAAHIGVTDRIFTRVGSGDDISRGASTFMVEMIEIANILNNATARSLVILDEVGRGTSTYDGLALAWSLVEHMHERIGARTLFATHYHQLTALSETLSGVCNLNVAVRETGDEITFLHRIVEGSTDRSYGIHVARLAGVPSDVLLRAEEVLRDLEAETDTHERNHIAAPGSTYPAAPTEPRQQPSRAEAILRELDVNAMTPIEALLKLQELRGVVE
jgi:DNA mismatch repair protein MutS